MKEKVKTVAVVIAVMFLIVAALCGLIRLRRINVPEPSYYEVRFDVGQYGVAISSVKVKCGKKIKLPEARCSASYCDFAVDYHTGKTSFLPQYTFGGWYYNGEKVDENNLIAFDEDVELTAKWYSLWTDFY